MARIHGQPGKSLIDQASKATIRMLILCCATTATIGYLAGLAFYFCTAGPLLSLVGLLSNIGLIIVVRGAFEKRVDELERERRNWRKGAVGEAIVGGIIAELSDDYFVFNNLCTPSGEFDHLIVGPTGVFVIETKNWRGFVTADSAGELLVNGKRQDRSVTRKLVAGLMSLRTQVSQWTQRDDYFQPVIVFTAAYVDIKFGSTKNVRCLREEQLLDYLRNRKVAQPLPKNVVRKITKVIYNFSQMQSPSPNTVTAPSMTVTAARQ